MLFFGGQDGEMSAYILTFECTVKPTVSIFAEEKAVIPYVNPPVRTLCAVDRCRVRRGQKNIQAKHL